MVHSYAKVQEFCTTRLVDEAYPEMVFSVLERLRLRQRLSNVEIVQREAQIWQWAQDAPRTTVQ